MGVSRERYVPSRGDVVWLTLDPTVGREQAERRPVLVLSGHRYNTLTGLMIICPITSQVKGYAFELRLDGKRVKGAVLADHVRSCDWQNRRVQLIETAKPDLVERTVKLLKVLISS